MKIDMTFPSYLRHCVKISDCYLNELAPSSDLPKEKKDIAQRSMNRKKKLSLKLLLYFQVHGVELFSISEISLLAKKAKIDEVELRSLISGYGHWKAMVTKSLGKEKG